jgi:ABC-type transport system substrate-binding protein
MGSRTGSAQQPVKFFIYSTPRSGSAWLANFLTYGGSFCQHEPLSSGEIVFADYPVSGAIDTGASFIGYLPPEGVKTYHLYRNPAEVKISLRRAGLPIYPMDDYRMGFEYGKLFDVGYLEYVWGEITGLPFDKTRAEMLIDLNVQRDIPALKEKLRNRIWHGLAH